GMISTIAGNGQPVFKVESATALGVSIDPTRVAVDRDGTVYIVDESNDRIRKMVVQKPATMTIASGNNQSGHAGDVLPISVRVADSSGIAVGNVAVRFAVSGGSASLSLSTAITGGDGTASIQATLSEALGPIAITATAAGLAPVTFALTSTEVPAG